MRVFFATFRTYYQVFFGVVIFLSILIQFLYGANVNGGLTLTYAAKFFSYFTIISNILVALVLGVEAYASLQKQTLPERFQSARAAVLFCILTTGVIYTFFLRGPGAMGQVQDSIPFINAIFHYLMPVAMTLDWLLFPAKKRIRWAAIPLWIAGTGLYALVVELFGLWAHEYPYFFLDPTKLRGYSGVLHACVAFVPFLLVFGVLVIVLNRVALLAVKRR